MQSWVAVPADLTAHPWPDQTDAGLAYDSPEAGCRFKYGDAEKPVGPQPAAR